MTTTAASVRNRSRAVATLWFAGLVAMIDVAMIGVYYTLRPVTEPWPAEEMTFDAYRGFIWSITSLLVTVFAMWGVWAARRELRSQANAAFALSLIMGLLSINMVAYVIAEFDFGAADGTYDLITYSALLLAPIVMAVACVALVAAVARSAAALTSGDHVGMVQQAAALAVLATSTTLAMYWLVWFVK